ncbi:MAG: hypothetical protein ACU88J_15665 [Gammaproteobacteria bacterium]
MNTRLVSVLAIICMVLALIIIGEWLYARQAQKRALAPTIPRETKTSLDEMPAIDLIKRTEESYADLVARPLFIKGRKPVDESNQEEAKGFAQANTFEWQLDGVYSTKKGLFALFSRSKSKISKDNYRKLTKNADLDDWNLSEIHMDRVLLKQGSEQKELLLRKPKIKELPLKAFTPNALKKPNVPKMPNTPNISNNPLTRNR